MISIGITGGVGSGKSAVCKYINEFYDVELIMADDLAKSLMAPGGACYEALYRRFSPLGLFLENGELDRAKMAKLAFNDQGLLKDLNGIVHPAVKDFIEERVLRARKENNPSGIIVEAALFSGDEYDTILDEYLFVYADTEVRVKRLSETRGYSREKSLSIMESQPSYEDFRKKCRFEIDNNDSIEAARQKTDSIMQWFRIGRR